MVVIESKRDQRVLDWLVEQVGHEAVAHACSKLAGSRKAYPSNIAKVLGLDPPSLLKLACEADSRRHLAEIARLLAVRSCCETPET